MIKDKKFDFWIQAKQNVLFIGKHGIGKTAQVVDAFNRNGLRWLYFSASTMDPWVDMIGVPKESHDDNGNRYLDLVRPKAFQFDEIDAIFFDELNRAPAKVRNAVMELIQFKSINGKKFNNLKIVWGAINPEDDDKTYDVERLDPAQKDRFQVHIELDYLPDLEYFTRKFGQDNAKAAIEWWNGLKDEVKELVSPRRLDYALDSYLIGGDLRDILPRQANVGRLTSLLSNGLAKDKVERLYKSQSFQELETFLANPNVYEELKDWMIEKPERIGRFTPYIPNETLTQVLSKNHDNPEVMKAMFANYYTSKFGELIATLNHATDGTNSQFRRALFNYVPRLTSKDTGKSPVEWTPTVKSDTNVINRLLEYQKLKPGTAESKSDKNRNSVMNDLQLIPANLTKEDADKLDKCVSLLIKSSDHIDNFLGNNLESVIGPWNFILKTANIDVTKSDMHKTLLNRFITEKLESNVWTPSSK